jgi:serine/threonine-protein kinase
MNSLPLENEVLAGKYRIERVVGRGGMGIVMAAWHLALDQRVAVKCLQPELAQNPESAARFLREARAAAKIKSEHGVRVLDVGNLDDGVPYMVMEFLDGRDLSDELRERGALPVEECINYALQAIEAVAEAHSLGIVHRDLKPENLFLARLPDGTRSVKVLDFGISKSMAIASSDNRSLTQSSTIMGSPLYMSPEQMRAPRTVDARTDIWSLGAIMYELLSGHPPYVADTLPQLCAKMLESDPDPLRSVRSDVDPDLERTVMMCLARDMKYRWSSMGELAQALLPFASRSARVHVERVSRVLNTTENNARMAPMTLQSRDQVRATPTRQSARDFDPNAQPARVPTPASNQQGPYNEQAPYAGLGGSQPHSGQPGLVASDTENRGAWENRPRQQTISASPPTGGRTTKIFLTIGAVAIVIGLGAFVWSKRASEASRSVTPVLSAAAEMTPPPEPPRAVAEALPVAPSPAPAVTAIEAMGLADAASRAAIEPEKPAETAPAVEGAPPSAPPAREAMVDTRTRRPQPAPAAPNPPAPAPNKGGLTDFGGRR